MITKVEFGLLMHVELMKEDSESHVSHNLKAKTSCDRQTNVTRMNFSTPLMGRCKLFTLLFLFGDQERISGKKFKQTSHENKENISQGINS